MDRAQIFGDNVRGLRNERELSQQALAAAAGLHFTAVSRIESADREPRLATIFALADALEVAPASLFEGIEPSRTG